jgi:hypothetical protein
MHNWTAKSPECRHQRIIRCYKSCGLPVRSATSVPEYEQSMEWNRKHVIPPPVTSQENFAFASGKDHDLRVPAAAAVCTGVNADLI